MLISIIIPIYKVEKYIEECLKSIKEQNFQDFEVLMINDGSPDNCHAICQKFAAADKRFRYFHQENKGVSAARNKGLAEAKGKYIYCMDPDDKFSPDFLQALHDEAEKTNADMVLNIGVLSCLTPKKTFPLHNTVPGCYEATIENYFIDGYLWFKLLRKDIIDRAGIKFTEGCHYREDELFGLMLYPYIQSYSVIQQGYYYYRQHGDSALAKLRKSRKRYAESMTVSLWNIFEFYKTRNFESYSFLAIQILPYFHEWYNKHHYWNLMQSLNNNYNLERWNKHLHLYLQTALKKQSYLLFLVRIWWLYRIGYVKRLRKKLFSIKIHKDYRLIKIFGITLLEKDQRNINTKKIA